MMTDWTLYKKEPANRWPRRWTLTLIFVILTAAYTGFGTPDAAGDTLSKITVFAAASTTNAVTEIAARFEKSHPGMVRLSFASSSTLAKQIEKGAPADIFLSANSKWMDYLAEKAAIVSSSRFNLLSNRIALIVPKEANTKNVLVDSNLDLHRLLGNGRLAIGNPDHVPAGIYGRKALEKLGLWNQVKEKLAPAKDVRAALVLVERGEAPLGQVYVTDAFVSRKVRIIGLFPENSHPPIVYPVALIRETDYSNQFMRFLTSEISAEIFRKYGFMIR